MPISTSDVLGKTIYQPTPDEQAALSGGGIHGLSGQRRRHYQHTLSEMAPALRKRLSLGSPDSACDGVNIYSKQVQNEYGFSGQSTWIANPASGEINSPPERQSTAAALATLRTRDYAYVNPNYASTSVPAWQDGSTVDANGNPIDRRVGLHGHTPNWSLYFADTLTLWKKVNVTVSGRYNRYTIDNIDLLNPIAGPGSLTGDYVFQRFNPAVGITWSPISSVNAYARFSQGSRAPTSIELGCADPSEPL